MGHSPAQQFAIAEEVSDLLFELREHILEGGRRLIRVECLIFSRCVDHDDYCRLCLTPATLLGAFRSSLFLGCGFGAIATGRDGRSARLQFDVSGNGCGRSVQTARVFRLRRNRHVSDGRISRVALDVIGGFVRRIGPEFP
jgi:hypothetical protein